MKKFISILFTFICLVALTAVSASAATGNCKAYGGTNIGRNDYCCWHEIDVNSYAFSNFALPVYSYLTKCSDGNYMKIQYSKYNSESYVADEKIIIEYFDENFNFINYKTVVPVLPIFGTFYETDDNYYIVSGQTNYEEKSNVECFNVAKYDKNWNYIKSIGLKDCNTIIPFDAGSVRVAINGNYMVIHTSHEMYKSADGLNHQSNYTLYFDMTTMSELYGSTTVYTSHSFNQFVLADENRFVTLDHGDAYPRSVTLNAFDTRSLFDKYYWLEEDFEDFPLDVNMLDIPGDTGSNYTGCTVGGFETSDTSYIVAGSCVDYNNFKKSKTRNIFVSVINKDNLNTEYKEIIIEGSDGFYDYEYEPPENNGTVAMLTSYKEGSESATNPYLIKINNNHFFIIWSRKNKVYYTELNGKGEVISETKSFKATLSDCKPIVSNSKIIWFSCYDHVYNENYVIGEKYLDFYTIDLNDTSKTNVITIENGKHNYEVTKVIEKATFTKTGKQKLTCKACGKTKTETVPKKTVGKVKNLKAKSTSKTKVTLSWSKTANAKKYNVYISTDGKSWEKLTTTSKTSYQVKKLNSGKVYRFKVRATNGKYTGKESSVFKVKTKLSAPDITLKAGRKKATLNIESIRGATYYQIVYSTDKNFENNVKKVYVDDAKTIKATVKKLKKGKKYYFKVRACCKYDGKKLYSAYSKTKSVKIK